MVVGAPALGGPLDFVHPAHPIATPLAAAQLKCGVHDCVCSCELNSSRAVRSCSAVTWRSSLYRYLSTLGLRLPGFTVYFLCSTTAATPQSAGFWLGGSNNEFSRFLTCRLKNVDRALRGRVSQNDRGQGKWRKYVHGVANPWIDDG